MQQLRHDMEKLQHQALDPSSFSIDELMQEYRKLSPRETKEHLRQKLKGKPLIDNPKVVDYVDAIMRDPQVMKDLWKIAQNRTKIIIFVACNILLFILGFWFKKRRARTKNNFGLIRSFILWSVRFAFAIAIRITLVVLFFGHELYRLARITQQHFF